MPASIAAPMSSVWTWQFQRPSPPTTTIESPRTDHAASSSCTRSSVDTRRYITSKRGPENGMGAGRARTLPRPAGAVTLGTGNGRPSTTDKSAAISSSKPRPPASTTPASARTARSSGVSATDRAAASAQTTSSCWSVIPASTSAESAAAAVAAATVRMVPSTGRRTALYAASAPRRSASARSRASTDSSGANTSPKDRRICDTMTPELPRAPINEPCERARHTSGMTAASPSSSQTDCSVSAKLVPVSPSGTGYTLSSLSSSAWVRSTSR